MYILFSLSESAPTCRLKSIASLISANVSIFSSISLLLLINVLTFLMSSPYSAFNAAVSSSIPVNAFSIGVPVGLELISFATSLALSFENVPTALVPSTNRYTVPGALPIGPNALPVYCVVFAIAGESPFIVPVAAKLGVYCVTLIVPVEELIGP